MSKNNGEKFFLAALIGAAAGAIAGVLLAPRSGKETRKIIKDKTKEYSDKSKEMIEKGAGVAKEKIKEAAETVAKKME